jgi:hypothetical protein
MSLAMQLKSILTLGGGFFIAPLVWAAQPPSKPPIQAATSVASAPSTVQFNYKFILIVDFKKREKILKAQNLEPTLWDKALARMSSEIHAGNVVDIVYKKNNLMRINSTLTPTSAIGLLIGDKKYTRESQSTLDKTGYKTYSYFEERGSDPRTTSLINYKLMNATYYVGPTIEKTEKITSDMSDMLNVIYEGIGGTGKKSSLSFWVNSSKSAMKMQFQAAELWDISVNGVKYKAKRYAKRTDKTDTATFEIWIDEASKMPLRYQIGLNENYGVTMLLELESFKKLDQ